MQLQALPSSAAEARRFALATLADWGLTRLKDTVTLLVTELVSNGVRHARTSLELRLSFDGSCLRIAVADGDARPPVARTREERTVGGWGLTLIDALSTEWGTDVEESRGKTVWFEIDTTAGASAPPGPPG
jgi:two-component sensor histidine kinase